MKLIFGSIFDWFTFEHYWVNIIKHTVFQVSLDEYGLFRLLKWHTLLLVFKRLTG